MEPRNLSAARSWLAQDPDPETRDELTALIASSDDPEAQAELEDRFGTRLAFGTAGLRGELGAGTNRMNRVLVAQAAAGLAAYLAENGSDDETPSVVVGYDGRRNSQRFALDSAEIFAGAGLHAILLPRMLPTPVLAFAVRYFNASAGVMVTASHNPPNDNGYKVYLGGDDQGSQIVPPADGEIARHIDRVATGGDITRIPRHLGYVRAGDDVVEAYIAATAAVAPAPESAAGMQWVYTAMHGVGWETTSRVVSAAGFPAPTVVSEQIDPDPAFPTVSFPNPEEPGAMDLAFETARSSNAEFVLANDPDADRLAVAVPDGAADGGWRRLSGNEVGLLLGWRAARRAAESREEQGTPTTTDVSLACSLVSSPGLEVIADHYGLDFFATLTGFKWISRAPGMAFGFEEALGYLVNPETVRDKDGISAAIAMLGLAADARGRGTTISGLLAEFEQTFGYFASDQISIRVEDLSVIDTIMTLLRKDQPDRFGTVKVKRVDDLLTGIDDLPPGNVLRFWLKGGSRIIVRPSGTEPKLKLYLDVRGSSAADAAERLAALTAGAREVLDSLS
ncbi:phospho-sugar mutase [Microbacterium endophyticum]|nr:phospho-sugar mutase [Microbacterium endophyticum]